MSSDSILRVDKISKVYQIYDRPLDRLLQMLYRGRRHFFEEHWALRDISFELMPGETLGVIGCNGAGKSTLLQIICGTLNPTSGSVKVSGRVAALLELGAGFNPEFSGRENVYLSGQLYGLSRNQIDEKYESILEFSGVRNYIAQPVKTYSSGMFVRLAFSVIAHLEPKILIVDEALAVGDFVFQQKCARFMREDLNNVAKILVSHDLSAIASMADRVLVLDHGKVVFLGETQTALTEYQRIARNSTEGKQVAIDSNIGVKKIIKFENELGDDWVDIEPSVLSGSGRAKIKRFSWDVDGRVSAKTISKNERIKIKFEFSVKEEIGCPIFGYQIQNRFGIPVFGENTESSGFVTGVLKPGCYIVNLNFIWPQVEPAEYGLTLGIGNGFDSTTHEVECWAHNVVVLGSVKTDPVHGVFNNKLVGFSMERQI